MNVSTWALPALWIIAWGMPLASLPPRPAGPPGSAKPPACRVETVEGELHPGESFSQVIGNGLRLWFQPVASGWILRVVPASGPVGEHDFAELATPPYRSVTPLSLSTDFAFRAQDAVGWNPRRFKFATSPAAFAQLDEVYTRLIAAGATPPAPLQLELSDQIAQASDGKLTIVDARLIPGVADQWKMAGAVSARFESTPHQFERSPDGKPTPLGRLTWIRFRVELALPPDFTVEKSSRVVPHPCGNL